MGKAIYFVSFSNIFFFNCYAAHSTMGSKVIPKNVLLIFFDVCYPFWVSEK